MKFFQFGLLLISTLFMAVLADDAAMDASDASANSTAMSTTASPPPTTPPASTTPSSTTPPPTKGSHPSCDTIKAKMQTVVEQCTTVQHGGLIDIEVNLNGFLGAFSDLNVEIGNYYGFLTPYEASGLFGDLISFKNDMDSCFKYISGLHVDVDILGIDVDVDLNLNIFINLFIGLWGFLNVWIGNFMGILPGPWGSRFFPVFGEITEMVQESCNVFGPFCP